MICQTKAILRYVGKLAKHGGSYLYPKDAFCAAKVDELIDAYDDLWILLAPSFAMKEQAQKEKARQALFAPGGPAAKKLEIFERILGESSNGFAVPQAGLSIADILYFCFL